MLVEMLPWGKMDASMANIREEKMEEVDLYLTKLFSRLKILA